MHRIVRSLPTATLLFSLTACDSRQGAPRDYPPTEEPLTFVAGGMSSPPPPKPFDEKHLCPKPGQFGYEEGHSQSRWFRGGCLENFQHFTTTDGRLPPSELSGVIIGEHVKLRGVRMTLKSLEIKKTPSGNGIHRYDVRMETANGWVNPCAATFHPPVRAGMPTQSPPDEYAVAVPGAWDQDTGEHFETTTDGKSVFTLACPSGAAAKAIEWGYLPDGMGSDTDLKEVYSTAVTAARGQYNCRSSASYTCTGTWVYVMDRFGIQKLGEEELKGLVLEAAWSAKGVSCMGQPRYPACDAEPAVRRLRKTKRCDDTLYKADPSRWPEDVLLVTYSRRDGDAPRGKCPNRLKTCG